MSGSIPLLMLVRTKRTDDVQHPYTSLLEMAFLVCYRTGYVAMWWVWVTTLNANWILGGQKK